MKTMSSSGASLRAWSVAWLVALGLTAGVASAAADDCRTWFPDLDPECQRSARPAGSVMPMSFPYIFEDPYITSGLNFVTVWHEYPNDSVFGGGDLWVLALQARLAITDRVAFIATKDGIGFNNPDRHAVLPDETGTFNITAGFKVKAWEYQGDDESAIISPSLRYEAPAGERDVYQGHDDGLFIPAISTAYQNGPWHGIFGLGGHIPIDGHKNSSNVFYNFHVDYAFPAEFAEWIDYIVPFIELNGIHWVGAGDGSRKVNTKLGVVDLETANGLLQLSPYEGVDVVNLGASGIGGGDYITMAWGLRVPLAMGLSLGVSYERPLSKRKDLTEQRVTTMVTWEF